MERIDDHGLSRHPAVNRFSPHGGAEMGLAPILPFAFDEADEIKHPVVDGRAVEYNTPTWFGDELWAFVPGCFSASLASGKNILLCAEHDTDCVLADRHSGFHLIDSVEGVDFRIDAKLSMNPLAVLGLVSSKNRRCVSIGFKPIDVEYHDCAGQKVKFITRAELIECSFVKRGKNVPAFAYVTDATKHPAPSKTGGSREFKRQQAAYIAERIDADAVPADLEARLSAIEVRLGIRSSSATQAHMNVNNRPLTPQQEIIESNRRQAREVRELQQHARRKNCNFYP